MKLSILIPTLPSRADKLQRLLEILKPQITNDVEILTDDRDRKTSTGTKRNALLNRAKGLYSVFIDDDDIVSPNYVKLLFEGIDKGMDCCSLVGLIDIGNEKRTFIHSLKYDSYHEKYGIYYRYPNHLNCMKTSIAKQIQFPDITISEDTKFATRLHESKLLKTEHVINETIYFYTPSNESY
jgi:glycosyltransferase involved in cell wall biosynthesis